MACPEFITSMNFRIVHVSAYYPPHLGGMEYRTKDVAESFAKREYRVDIFTSNIGCRNGKLQGTKNVHIHYLQAIEFAHTAIMPSLFFHLLFLPKNSVVHLHVAHAVTAEITYLVCKLRKLPYIAHIHLDVSATGRAGFLLPFYKKYFLAPVLRHADAILVLTEDYRSLIHKKYAISEENIHVIPNGTYFPLANNRHTSVHKPIRLLFLGRFSKQKNLPLLLDALVAFRSRYALDVHLTIAGNGEEKSTILNHIQKKNIASCVTMKGEVSPKTAQKLYSMSDIFILPSSEESFGTVLIEAMASGTAIIATNILAVRNIIKHGRNGLLVEQNPIDLAKAIYLLATNGKLRKKLVAQGKKDVIQYNWEKITDRYEALYQMVLRRRKT